MMRNLKLGHFYRHAFTGFASFLKSIKLRLSQSYDVVTDQVFVKKDVETTGFLQLMLF